MKKTGKKKKKNNLCTNIFSRKLLLFYFNISISLYFFSPISMNVFKKATNIYLTIQNENTLKLNNSTQLNDKFSQHDDIW